MSDTAIRLRNFLLEDATIAGIVGSKVIQGQVRQKVEPPWIYIRRNSRTPSDDLNDNTPLSETFDVECVSDDLDEAQALSEAIWALDQHHGTFDDSTTGGVFIQDQSDDYIPFSVGDDDGYQIASLILTVYL